MCLAACRAPAPEHVSHVRHRAKSHRQRDDDGRERLHTLVPRENGTERRKVEIKKRKKKRRKRKGYRVYVFGMQNVRVYVFVCVCETENERDDAKLYRIDRRRFCARGSSIKILFTPLSSSGYGPNINKMRRQTAAVQEKHRPARARGAAHSSAWQLLIKCKDNILMHERVKLDSFLRIYARHCGSRARERSWE